MPQKPEAQERRILSSNDGDDILVDIVGLRKLFHIPGMKEPLPAVDNVTLMIPRGGSLGLVGESGSGKTTLGRCLLRLLDFEQGKVMFSGVDIASLSSREMRRMRWRMTMVFQNPYEALNPRWRVKRTLEDPMLVKGGMSKLERRTRVTELLELVRLEESFLERYPHQLSGGQLQRIGVARALATNPHFVVLDEPTSALDWLVRYDVLALLNQLRVELGLTYLLVSHDLSAVEVTCDSVAVMYLGQIVEHARTDVLFAAPQHPYTRALLSALLEPRVMAGRRRVRLAGTLDALSHFPTGCRLHPRCPVAVPECKVTRQELQPLGENHVVACMRVTHRENIDWPEGW